MLICVKAKDSFLPSAAGALAVVAKPFSRRDFIASLDVWHVHQMGSLVVPDLGDRVLVLLGMKELVPKGPTALLEPHVQVD